MRYNRLMKLKPLLTSMAHPHDARTYSLLGYPVDAPPLQETLDKEIAQYLAAPAQVAENRFIGWVEGKAVARFQLRRLETVVELRDFFVLEGYVSDYGPIVLEKAIELVSPSGTLLTIERYPASYSNIFLGAGFKENIRTRMIMTLDNYSPGPVELPDGIKLRHPTFCDEKIVVNMVYDNYKNTPEAAMVSSSRAQAEEIMRAIFHNDYYLLEPNASYLAEDEAGKLVGDVFVGDASASANERIAWVMDISLAQEWRGKGVGRTLLISALNAVLERGYPAIGLMVTIGNERAYTLYRSLGFEGYGETIYEAMLRLSETSGRAYSTLNRP